MVAGSGAASCDFYLPSSNTVCTSVQPSSSSNLPKLNEAPAAASFAVVALYFTTLVLFRTLLM